MQGWQPCFYRNNNEKFVWAAKVSDIQQTHVRKYFKFKCGPLKMHLNTNLFIELVEMRIKKNSKHARLQYLLFKEKKQQIIICRAHHFFCCFSVGQPDCWASSFPCGAHLDDCDVVTTTQVAVHGTLIVLELDLVEPP